MYPFGYGLSYTSFDYTNFCLSDSVMPMDGTITASVDITNTGEREGTEVVQLYIGDRVAKGVRPYKELRGYERITLQPKETRTVQFAIDADLLSYFEPYHLQWTIDPERWRSMWDPMPVRRRCV